MFVTQSIRFSDGFIWGFFLPNMEILSLSLPEKIVCENICLLLKALLIHVCFSPALFWSYPGLQPHSTGISLSNIESLILALIWTKAACLKKEKH